MCGVIKIFVMAKNEKGKGHSSRKYGEEWKEGE